MRSIDVDSMPPFIPPQERSAWKALSALAHPSPHLRELLAQPERPTRYRAQGAGLTLDFSHQRVTDEVLNKLFELAEASDVQGQWKKMIAGEPVNATENRPVLHVALRGSDLSDAPWGQAISEQVRLELDRVCAFAERLRNGQVKGHSGLPITHVVNLGIGGSDLGPRMATEALARLDGERKVQPVRLHYVSNVDAWSLATTLAPLQAARTLFIVQSKTFTTQETLTLFASAQRWLRDGGCARADMHLHLAAVTAQPKLAQAHDVAAARCFRIWDWVGGQIGRAHV